MRSLTTIAALAHSRETVLAVARTAEQIAPAAVALARAMAPIARQHGAIAAALAPSIAAAGGARAIVGRMDEGQYHPRKMNPDE